uniref:ATP synthase peripheral stalk subunit F6, mitochondrial n=1 Tax=Sinocyclocheilus anshuiensis TaxID=1608454 RepID=A0A671Q1P5_9TELE
MYLFLTRILLHSVFTQLGWISLTSVAQLDPIQKLFLDKIREYSTKSQASGGPVDAGPEYEKAFSEELNKLQRLYGSGDLTEFPEFKFSGGERFSQYRNVSSHLININEQSCLRAVTL